MLTLATWSAHRAADQRQINQVAYQHSMWARHALCNKQLGEDGWRKNVCLSASAISVRVKSRPRTGTLRTANSRAGNPVRIAKLRQAVAEGRWQNPHQLRPPTGAEQAARSRKGRLREVAEGRWRNPALEPAARVKLSRPRKHDDEPVLHRALEQLKQGARMAELGAAERERYLAYRRQLREARLTEVRAYQRARYRRIMDAADPTMRERLRALWRQQNQRRAARGPAA